MTAENWGTPVPASAKRAEKRRRQRAAGFVQRRRPAPVMPTYGETDRHDKPQERRP